jgi:pimeloyl-ACP methyl ester carboxylesterase
LLLWCRCAGLDASVLSGGLPELVVIGVPPGLNGSACPGELPAGPESLCSQRYFELTPTPCSPAAAECLPGQPSGGADLLLRFVWDTVLPAVLAQLALQPGGEVSIVGYSLGGLTAGYAASSQPTLFQRAFCMSPSAWWNAGELADIILSNYEATGAKPVSIVMELGTQEGPMIVSSNHDPRACTVYLDAVVSAWQSIGMGQGQSSSSSSCCCSSSTLATNLFYYSTAGGIHNIISWVDTAAFGLSLLFRPEFPAAFPQSSARTAWQYPPPPPGSDCGVPGEDSDTDNNSDDENKTLLVVALLAFCALLLPANVYYVSKLMFAQQDGVLLPEYKLIDEKQEGDGSDRICDR